jgi:hypothetical protein
MGGEVMTPPAEVKVRGPINCREVLSDETRILLAHMVRDEMRLAIADGISAAMTDETAERFWSKGLEVLQKQAQRKAGEFLLEGVGAAIKKAAWITLIVAAVYTLGGWHLAKSVWASLMKG